MEEIWKTVVGYEGKYDVSNYGRVRSYFIKGSQGSTSNDGYIMKLKSDKADYQLVGLTANRKQKVLKVHRLVAQAFIDDFNELNDKGYHVDHIDGNVKNNKLTNLQMLTHFDNCLKRTGSNRNQKVRAVHLDSGKEYLFNGQNEAARELNLNQGNIYHVLAGKMKQYKGYCFERV